jgi:hypothetical protein
MKLTLGNGLANMLVSITNYIQFFALFAFLYLTLCFTISYFQILVQLPELN